MFRVQCEVLGVIGGLLALLPQIVLYVVQSAMLVVSEMRKVKLKEIKAGVPRNISFIMPVKKEPLNYIEEAIKYVGSLGIPNYEIIIVSDDSEDVKYELFSMVNRLRANGFNVWIIWRSEPRGLRTGALNTGLYASIGDFTYILDVDSRPEKCFFSYAIGILESCSDCVAVTGRWEPLNRDSRISEALALGLKYLARVLYRARSRLGLFTYPLGTGTLYNARTLKETLKGWDESKIQDDMELGTRIMSAGLKVVYVDDCAIYVENPSSYRGFRIQQSRWAYGAMDVAVSNLRHILSSRRPALIKLEAVLYLLQYLPQSFTFIGTTALCVSVLICPHDPLKDVASLAIAWLLALLLYSILMFREAFPERSLWKFIVLAGRLSALSIAASPYVTLYTFKALLRLKQTYQRTPKGFYQTIRSSTRIPWELIVGAILITVGISSLLSGYLVTAIWLSLMGSGYIYVVIRFTSDIIYD